MDGKCQAPPSIAREGETVRLHVRIENASGKGQGMMVAILGLPGGLTIPEVNITARAE